MKLNRWITLCMFGLTMLSCNLSTSMAPTSTATAESVTEPVVILLEAYNTLPPAIDTPTATATYTPTATITPTITPTSTATEIPTHTKTSTPPVDPRGTLIAFQNCEYEQDAWTMVEGYFSPMCVPLLRNGSSIAVHVIFHREETGEPDPSTFYLGRDYEGNILSYTTFKMDLPAGMYAIHGSVDGEIEISAWYRPTGFNIFTTEVVENIGFYCVEAQVSELNFQAAEIQIGLFDDRGGASYSLEITPGTCEQATESESS